MEIFFILCFLFLFFFLVLIPRKPRCIFYFPARLSLEETHFKCLTATSGLRNSCLSDTPGASLGLDFAQTGTQEGGAGTCEKRGDVGRRRDLQC